MTQQLHGDIFEATNKGMDEFVEIEAMIHASDNNKKENFKMVSECALVMQHNCLLESKIKEWELMKHLDAQNCNDENNKIKRLQ